MSSETSAPRPGLLRGLQAALFRPVDGASLVWFRVVFGFIMVWEALRYTLYGWVEEHYIAPALHFKYWGWEWVPHPPGDWVYLLVAGWGLAALGIGLGAFYRVSAVAFAVLFPWFFFLEQAKYLNHLYLVCLLSLLVVLVPAHRLVSIDAWRRPELRRDHAPAWALWLLRFQFGLVYFYAGVAKINGDWLQGEPMRTWMAKRVDYPIFGPLVASEPGAWFLSYSGLLFDLLVAPALLWKRTRGLALAAVVFFHLSNSYLFSIGIFPWLMLCATLLFLEPDWPRRVFPVLFPEPLPVPPRRIAPGPGRRTALLSVLALWVGWQVLMPLRHHLYPGNVAWTEEGHMYSWRMKLRSKSGRARFHLLDQDTGETWSVYPRAHLTSRQLRKMSTRPDMAHQFALWLAEQARRDGHARVSVYSEIEANLNGRPRQLLIEPTVDLAATPRSLGSRDYITALAAPLPEARWAWADRMERPRAPDAGTLPVGGDEPPEPVGEEDE